MQKNKTEFNSPIFKLKKPSFNEENYANLSEALVNDAKHIKQLVSAANSPKYIYYDTFKYKSLSGKLSVEEQWLLVRFYRDASALDTPIKSVSGKHFKWMRLLDTDEKLHKIDMLVGGGLFPQSQIPIEGRETYISRGVIEESIASSQLEGAHTTRAVAKKMILEKKKPKNKSEQMILNNYRAMLALEEDFRKRELSRDMLFELHAILTDQTLDKNEQKRFRMDSDQISVQGMIGSENYVTHVPPRETMLQVEIDRLIAYANDDFEEKFIHPIIKAIFIHFWVGYLHPFTDGNGRLARTLFYWYLLKKGYWAFAYIPISTVIKRSPVQYSMAYIYAEQDHEDLTYFFDYQMRKIDQAMTDFSNYLSGQVNQNQQVEDVLSSALSVSLNSRQKQLVFYLISEKNASTTTSSHSTINNVSRQTATKDLKKLEGLGLVKIKKEGKYVRYYAAAELKKLLI